MEEWRGDPETWLSPFVAALRHRTRGSKTRGRKTRGRKTRGRMCPACGAGLIGPGERKSVQPMAARDVAVSDDRLHPFIADGVRDSAPLEEALLSRPC